MNFSPAMYDGGDDADFDPQIDAAMFEGGGDDEYISDFETTGSMTGGADDEECAVMEGGVALIKRAGEATRAMGTGAAKGMKSMVTGLGNMGTSAVSGARTGLHNLTHPREIQLRSIIDKKIEKGADDKTKTLKEVSIFVEELYKELKLEVPPENLTGGSNEAETGSEQVAKPEKPKDNILAVIQLNVLKNVDKKISNTGALDITNSKIISRLSDAEKNKVKTMYLSLVYDIIVFVIKMLHVNAILKPYAEGTKEKYEGMINKATDAKDLTLKEYIDLFKKNTDQAEGGRIQNFVGRKNEEIKKELDYLDGFEDLQGYADLENSMVKNIEGLIKN